MIVQFDFDGTLAIGDNTSIQDMQPNTEFINLCNRLYKDGNTIEVVTARGSKSCKTIEDRIKKYNKVIEDWLQKNGVLYHKLSFLKLYADIYIDDRSINTKESFLYENLDAGFTDNKVRRINNQVIKNCKDAIDQKNWYKKAKEMGINVPNVIHADIDTITLEYIAGSYNKDYKLNAEILDMFILNNPTNNADYNSYIDRIKKHIDNNKSIIDGDKLITKLFSIDILNTFSHGDFSIHNLIFSNNQVYVIDPIHNEATFQSFVIDIAKNLFTTLFYSLDYILYEEAKDFYCERYGLQSKHLDILIAAEAVRVATYNKKYNNIANNLIQGL